MIVLVTSAIPNLLRGRLSRWLFELEPGIFVGNVSARVREELWVEIEEERGKGRALLVYSAQNEQGLAFRTVGSTWQPCEIEGLTLLMRSEQGRKKTRRNAANGSEDEKERKNKSEKSEGWSIAARRRRFKNAVEKQAHW